MRIVALGALFLFATATSLAAQTPPPAPPQNEAELAAQATQLLVTFGRLAEGARMHSKARVAWQQILDHYDKEQPAARAGLGWKKVKDEWQAGDPSKLPTDAGTPGQQKQIADAWITLTKKLVPLHRGLAERLFATGQEDRAKVQFERILFYDPSDSKSHEAIGHHGFEGFWGTAEQVALAKRMREIIAKGKEIAATDIPVEPLSPEQMPSELKATGRQFHGGSAKNFTFWAMEPNAAIEAAKWAERSLLLLDWLHPANPGKRGALNVNGMRWCVLVRSNDDRNHLLQSDKRFLGPFPMSVGKVSGGISFTSSSGRGAWQLHDEPLDADYAVGLIAKHCMNVEGAGSEGLVHAMTWLLADTVWCRYSKPATVAGGRDAELARDPSAWLAHIREQVGRNADMPIAQAACERLDHFREPVRAKMWLFVLFVMARYPEDWSTLLQGLSTDQPTEPVQAEAIKKALVREALDLDLEWRDWVRAGSKLGEVSGLPK